MVSELYSCCIFVLEVGVSLVRSQTPFLFDYILIFNKSIIGC